MMTMVMMVMIDDSDDDDDGGSGDDDDNGDDWMLSRNSSYIFSTATTKATTTGTTTTTVGQPRVSRFTSHCTGAFRHATLHWCDLRSGRPSETPPRKATHIGRCLVRGMRARSISYARQRWLVGPPRERGGWDIGVTRLLAQETPGSVATARGAAANPSARCAAAKCSLFVQEASRSRLPSRLSRLQIPRFINGTRLMRLVDTGAVRTLTVWNLISVLWQFWCLSRWWSQS